MKCLLFFTVIPLAAAFLIALLNKRGRNFPEIAANSGAMILCACAFSTAKITALNKAVLFKVGGWLPSVGIALFADGLSGFMLLAVNLISVPVLLYAVSYIRRYSDKWKFYSLFMLMLAGMNGVILSADIFSLYVFLELASISAYCLVAFGVEAEGLEAAFKYAAMGILASIFILLGIALLYGYTSTLNLADISLVLADKPRGVLLGLVSVLFLTGFGLKAAIVPFHAWLPDAHASAPSPVSAMLSGVFIKALGVYALCRVFFNVVGVSENLLSVLLVLGIASMCLGALLAIAQSDIKRMFAYSSISQVGYIIFALGLGTPLGVFAGLFHLFNHAVFKSLLFLNAGAIEYATGNRSLNKLGGLNARLPVTGATGLIAAMSVSGIPPLGGFWSKFLIIVAAVESGHPGLAIAAALVSIITLAYYAKFQSFAFFGKMDAAYEKIKEVPALMQVAMIVLASACLLSGLLLMPAFRPFLQSAADVVLSTASYKNAFWGALR